MNDAPSGFSRAAWWLVSCIACGWLVVYTVLRLGGDYPSEAATPALVGAAGGAVAFVAGFIIVRRLHASGVRVYARASLEDGEPASGTHAAWRAAAVLLLGAAAVALVLVAVMGRDYLEITGARPRSTLLLLAWNAVFALWAGEEAVRVLRARDADAVDASGFDSVWFACLLTCVLAGVAFSRDLFPALQVVLTAVAGLSGAVVAVALWRHRGARDAPLGAVGALLVAALSLALPILV